MNQNEIITKLREPFPFKEVEWKLQTTTTTADNRLRGLAVPYIDSRAIQKRLDDVVGAFNWQNTYSSWQDKAQICGISVYNSERGEWVTKYDGAENSAYEPIKGGLSDSMKRAAIQWGVGRYLYELDGVWCDVETKGKSHIIRKDQFILLETEYNRAVAAIFGAAPPPNQNEAPNSPPNNPQQRPLPEAPPAPQSPNDGQIPDSFYRIHSVKPSGKNSQVLELIDTNGEVITAYVQSTDAAIKAGINIRNVKIDSKTSQYGPYNLINSYEVAA